MKTYLVASIAIVLFSLSLHACQGVAKANPDTERSKLLQELKMSEQAVSDLAKEIQDATDEKVSQLVRNAFLAKQSLQQHDLKRTKEKLAKLEAQLAEREASMQEIVQRRIAELRANQFDTTLENTQQELDAGLEKSREVDSNALVQLPSGIPGVGARAEMYGSLWEKKRQISQSLALVSKTLQQLDDKHP